LTSVERTDARKAVACEYSRLFTLPPLAAASGWSARRRLFSQARKAGRKRDYQGVAKR